MAFITNRKDSDAKKLGDRLAELMAHSDRLDILVGFFFFSGVKVLYDALKTRANMQLRVLVEMEAEMAMGHLVESMKKDGNNSADVTPYEAYYLVLKQYLEYQQSSLNEERLNRLLKDAGFDKYRYQVDAVAQAVRGSSLQDG